MVSIPPPSFRRYVHPDVLKSPDVRRACNLLFVFAFVRPISLCEYMFSRWWVEVNAVSSSSSRQAKKKMTDFEYLADTERIVALTFLLVSF